MIGRVLSVLISLLIFSCQSTPDQQVSMYDVSRDMKRMDEDERQEEVRQSAPQMKSRKYTPAEQFILAGLMTTALPAQIADINLSKRKVNFTEFLSEKDEEDAQFQIESKIKRPKEEKLDICVLNMNCSETLKKKEKKDFFIIELPGLFDD